MYELCPPPFVIISSTSCDKTTRQNKNTRTNGMVTTRQDGTTKHPSHHNSCRQLSCSTPALVEASYIGSEICGKIGRAYANHTNAMKHINMDLKTRQHARRLLWVTRRNKRIIIIVKSPAARPSLKRPASRDISGICFSPEFAHEQQITTAS